MKTNREVIEEFLLPKLCDVYNRPINKNLIEFWEVGLEEHKPENIIKAYKGFAQRNECHYFPTPKEFIRFERDPNPYPHL